MLILTATEFQIRLNVERLTITVERKNAMRCVGKVNAVRERMQCGDFIGAPHCHSRQSRQKLRAIFREIREIITLVFSSDAARRRPYPLIAHRSSLTAQCSLPRNCDYPLHRRAIKNERRFLHKVEAIHRGMKGDSMAK